MKSLALNFFLRKVLRMPFGALLVLFVSSASLHAQETVVDITDKVLIDKCKRFGMNIGGDDSWNPKQKRRCAINFEGTAYRRVIHADANCTEDTITTFMVNDDWKAILTKNGKGTFTVLSGASKGIKGKIVSVEQAGKAVRWPPAKEEMLYKITVDQKLAGMVRNDGILVEALHFDEGQILYGGSSFYTTKKQENYAISTDVPPGSFGQSALKVSNDKFILRSGTRSKDAKDITLRGSFWAKAAASGASVSASCAKKPVGDFALTSDWKKFDFSIPLESGASGGGEGEVWVEFVAKGDVLLDDLESEMVGDPNPTPFYDEFYKLVKDFNPGIIRYLQMGGSTVDNFINPPLRQHSFVHNLSMKMGPHVGHNSHDYNMVAFYTMCEQMGAEPWLNLPGTINAEQVARYMEFLGGDTSTPGGKLRAEQGHPKPFTETLSGIHVEFGNEIWNFMDPYYGCGYNGPDFWQGLIASGKASPHYKPNIIFHVGGRGWPDLKPVPEYVPNADRFTWAPYILHEFKKEQEAQLGSDENIVRWAFSYSINNALGKGEMVNALKQAKGIAPLSIYEISHHLMFIPVDEKSVSARARNIIQGTLAGGMNVSNSMLMNLRYTGAFDQCFFSHNKPLKKLPFDIEKDIFNPWSTHMVNEKGDVVYQPKFLAISTINKVIGKELLETVHSGAKPTFDGFEYKKLTPVPGLDCFWSYAFRDGSKRGLVLMSLDLEKTTSAKINFTGKPKSGAKSYLLTGPSFKSTNVGPEPEVKVVESEMKDFAPGVTVQVPPSSMLALSWESE